MRDLYFRLNVIPIHLPPLRERMHDIPQLVDFFIKKYSRKFGKKVKGFDVSALEVLKKYHWPGNIRELENLIERIVAVSEEEKIRLKDIPLEYYMPYLNNNTESPSEDLLKKACITFERNFILKILERMKWNRRKAADALGIPLSTLKYKMKQLEMYQMIDTVRNPLVNQDDE